MEQYQAITDTRLTGVKESLRNIETQIGQLSSGSSISQKCDLPINIEGNPREVNAIFRRSVKKDGKDFEVSEELWDTYQEFEERETGDKLKHNAKVYQSQESVHTEVKNEVPTSCKSYGGSHETMHSISLPSQAMYYTPDLNSMQENAHYVAQNRGQYNAHSSDSLDNNQAYQKHLQNVQPGHFSQQAPQRLGFLYHGSAQYPQVNQAPRPFSLVEAPHGFHSQGLQQPQVQVPPVQQAFEKQMLWENSMEQRATAVANTIKNLDQYRGSTDAQLTNLQASMRNLETQVGQLTENSNTAPRGRLPSNTIRNLKEVNAIFSKSRKQVGADFETNRGLSEEEIVVEEEKIGSELELEGKVDQGQASKSKEDEFENDRAIPTLPNNSRATPPPSTPTGNGETNMQVCVDKKGLKNILADHLSRLQQVEVAGTFEREIDDHFPKDKLFDIDSEILEGPLSFSPGNPKAPPWYASVFE